MKTSNFKLPYFLTSSFKLCTSNFKLRTSSFELQPSNFVLQTLNFVLQASYFILRTSHFKPRYFIHKLLFLLISTFLTLSTNAQTYHFKNFNVNSGLPQSTVYCMLNDQQGYIWMGTEGGGVFKFNGKDGKVYNKSNGLSGNIVRSLFEDSKGNIWIGTDNGITMFDGVNFNKYTHHSFLGATVLNFCEDNSGNIWAATNNNGANCIKNYKDSLTVETYDISDGLISNFAFDIYEDKNNRIWLAMVGGISILSFNDTIPDVTKLSAGYDVPDNLILCIEEDINGKLWFGTYNSGTFYFENIDDLNNLNYKTTYLPELNSDAIWDIEKGNNDELWFATNSNGAVKLKNNVFTKFNTNNGLQSNQIVCILFDKNEKTWVGTVGNGASMFGGNKFVSFNNKDGIVSNSVTGFIMFDNNSFLATTTTGMSKVSIQKNNQLICETIIDNQPIKSVTQAPNGLSFVASDNEIFTYANNKLTNFKSFPNDFKINYIYADSKSQLWIASNSGYYKISENNEYNFNEDDGLVNNEVQFILEDSEENIWLATLKGLVRIKGASYTDFDEVEGLSTTQTHSLCEDINGNIFIGTFGGGLFYFNKQKDSLPISLLADQALLTSNNIYGLFLFNDTMLTVATDKGFDKLILDNKRQIKQSIKYYLTEGEIIGENNLNAIYKLSESELLLGTVNGFTKHSTEQKKSSHKLPVLISNIHLFFENINWAERGIDVRKHVGTPNQFDFSYKENHLTFFNAAINFDAPNQIRYKYRLLGQTDKWSPFTSSYSRLYSSIKPGKYTYQVMAIDKYNNASEVSEVHFNIWPPFWQTVWFYIVVAIVLTLIIVFYIRYREQKLREEKIHLEKIVAERTAEVVKQKNDIEKKNVILEKQKAEILEQKEEITASIQYAQRIQTAIVPNHETAKSLLKNYFLLWKPRDIVSGDFWWIGEQGNYVVATAADCTGHGVPGAFMSMLGVSFLNEIVKQQHITQSDDILNRLRDKVKTTLGQTDHNSTSKDGMDMGLLVIDFEKKQAQFSGAYNPLYIYRKGELIEHKATRNPIAVYIKEKPFEQNLIELQNGDTLYMFSDGFPDQFGGEKEKKYSTKRFKEYLGSIQEHPMDEQKALLNYEIEDWMKNTQQIDDIIVLGIRI